MSLTLTAGRAALVKLGVNTDISEPGTEAEAGTESEGQKDGRHKEINIQSKTIIRFSRLWALDSLG